LLVIFKAIILCQQKLFKRLFSYVPGFADHFHMCYSTKQCNKTPIFVSKDTLSSLSIVPTSSFFGLELYSLFTSVAFNFCQSLTLFEIQYTCQPRDLPGSGRITPDIIGLANGSLLTWIGLFLVDTVMKKCETSDMYYEGQRLWQGNTFLQYILRLFSEKNISDTAVPFKEELLTVI
jgi:hypothetical protein